MEKPMPNDDAYLLALGRQLEPIIQQWLAQMALDRTERAIHDTKVEQLTGISAHEAPPYSKDAAYWTIHETVPHDQPDLQIDETWTNIHAHLFPLCENILSRRAHTLEGLRVQTIAVSLAAAELWDRGHNHDGPPHERMFIEAASTFLGVVPVPLRTGRTGDIHAHPNG
jgi:hypothetical protein